MKRLLLLLFLGLFVQNQPVWAAKQGRANLYLRDATTGQASVAAAVGDILSLELFIEGRQEQMTGADIFLSFDDSFMELIPARITPQFAAFTQGAYLGGNIVQNNTQGDVIGDSDANNQAGFQLHYNEDIPASFGGTQRFGAGDGVLASFRLRVIQKPVNGFTVVNVVSASPSGGETGYFKVGDPGNIYSFNLITSLSLNIQGLESISLPDLLMRPGQVDSTLDIDDYINDASNADSTIVWTNSVPVPDSLQVGINPVSHRVRVDPWVINGVDTTNFIGIAQVQFTGTTRFDETVSDAIRILVDTPPVFVGALIPNPVIYFEDRDTTFTLVAVDPDPGAELTFTPLDVVENITATIDTQSVKQDTIFQVVQMQATGDFFGTAQMRFSVTDQFGLADTFAVNLDIKPVNDPPRYKKAFPEVVVNALSQEMLVLSEFVEDIDDPFNRLQFAFTGVDSIAFDISDNNGQMIITPVTPFQGTRTANVVVTDTSNAAAIQKITVIVNPPKDPQAPQVTVPDLKVNVRAGSEASTTALDALVTDIDTPDDQLTWTRGAVSRVQVDASALGNRQLRVSAPADSTGYRTLQLKVTDPTILTDSLSVRIYASSISTGIPVAGGMPDITLVSGLKDSLRLDDYYFDADHTDAEVTWSALGNLDVGVTIDPTTHLAVFEALNGATNVVEDIIFTVRDPQGQAATDTVQVTVLDPGSILLDLSILGSSVDIGLGKPDTLALRPLVRIGNPDSISWGVNSRDPSVVFAQSIGDELLLIGVRIGNSRLVLTATDQNSGKSTQDSILVNVGVQGGNPDDLVLEDVGELSLTAGRDTTLDLTVLVAAGNLANLVWSVGPNENIAVEIDTLNQLAIVRAPVGFLGNAGDLVFQAEDIVTGKTASSVASPVLVGRGDAFPKDLLKIKVVRNPVLKNFLDVFVRARRTLQNVPILDVRLGEDSTVPRTNISVDPVALVADMWVGDLRLDNATTGLVELTTIGITQDTRVALFDTLRLVVEQATVRSSFGLAHQDVAVSVPSGGVNASSAVVLIPERREIALAKPTVSDLVPVSDTYMVYAPQADIVRPGQIQFALSEVPEHAGIYREDAFTGKWVLVGNEIQDGRLVGEFDAFGRYGVFVDLNPVSRIELHQNFPNPFNPQTTIRFDLSDADQVQLIIYNALGQEIRHLVSGYLSSGRHAVTWDARDAFGRTVSAGVYVYQLKTTQSAITRKMLLLK